MMSEPGRGRDGEDGEDDDFSAEPPAFSDPALSESGMRRIIYGDDRRMVSDALSGRAPDARSRLFAEDTAELQGSLRGHRNLVPIVTALAAVVCFAAVVWYAYTWGTGQLESEDLPVVHAEPMPEKVRPEQPGGMEVPHQGMAVLNGGSQAPQTVERLLPRPEIPAPPEPLPAPPAATAEAAPEAPLAEPPPEAPLVADGSDAATEAPAGPAQDETVQDETAQDETASDETARDGIAKPRPKPDDQIARLLEKEALETANGDAAGPAAAAPAAPPMPAAPEQMAPEQMARVQTAKATPGDIMLQLSSVKSEAGAVQEWERLKAAHPGLLGKLGLSLETAAVQGTTYYRVQTGPFASRDAAAKVCAQLKARDQDCLVKQR